MALGQVDDVDIVTHARAVLGRVVRAEDRQGLALAHRHLTVGKAAPFGAVVVAGAAARGVLRRGRAGGGAGVAGAASLLDEGHEVVGDALGILADEAALVRADRVEVAQQHDVPRVVRPAHRAERCQR